MNRREKRLARNRRIDAFDDYGIVAHASADKTFLSGKRRRRAFAYNPIFLTIVLFSPGEIVVVVHFFDNLCAQNILNDAAGDCFASGVGVAAGQVHSSEIIVTDLRIFFDNRRRDVHSVFSARCFQKMRRRFVTKASRAEMRADPDAICFVGKKVYVMVSAADGAKLVGCHRFQIAN